MSKKSTQVTAKKEEQLEVTVSSFQPTISNITSSMDELYNIAPRSAFFATASILGTLGYAVVNQLIWANRKARKNVSEAPPDICVWNKERADEMIAISDKRNAREQGMTELPVWDATPLAGVYMRMLAIQMSESYASQFRPTEPHEIIRGIINNTNEQLIDSAYTEFLAKEIGSSIAAKAIQKASGSVNAKLDAQQLANNKAEENSVLIHLRDVLSDSLHDEAWETIPLFIQYRFAYAVYKQALKAFAFMLRTDRRPDDKATRLIKLIETLTLELQAAGRTTEVKLAFELERMGSSENIIDEIVEKPGANLAPTISPAKEMMIDGKLQKVRTRQSERV